MQTGEGHGKPHAYVVGAPRHSEGHGGTHLYVTASNRWTPPELIPEHREALDEDDHSTRKRKLLDLAKKPKPGTTIWRGEVRHKDDLEKPPSVGLHWSVNPDQVISPYDVPKDHHRVIWEAKVDHPDEQTIHRSHPIWYGRHQSMDSEAEVRLHPRAKVRITRRYVHNGEGNSAQPYVRNPSGSDKGWSAHDMDHHADVAHKRAGDDGLMDYHKAYPDLFGEKPKPREGHSEVLYYGSTHPRKFPIVAPDSFESETHVRTSTDWNEAYDHASEKVMKSYESEDPEDHLKFDDIRVYRVEHRGTEPPHHASPTERHHQRGVRILHDATEGPHVTGARRDHRYWHEVLGTEMAAPGMHHLPNNPSAAKAVSAHLDAQGEPEDSPLRGVLGNGKTSHQLVHRSQDGRITGGVAYTHYPRDREISIHDVRAMRKGEGIGTSMITELARRHPEHTMTVYNVVDNARNFYASTGADFNSWSSVGSWDHEAMEGLRNGSPLRKQAPPKERPGRIVETSRRTASIPPRQRELMALPGGQDKHRKMLDLAKNPEPGTHVWRGEVRHKDDLHAPESVGLHWTVNPDAVVMRGNQHLVDDLGHSPDHRRVLWQGVIHEPERELIPRSHPIWSGRHQSFDNEAEVRYHPQAKVHLTGAYVYHGDGDPTGPSTAPPDPGGTGESRGWSFHPMDHHAAVHHGRPKGTGLMDYQEDYPDLFGGQKKPDPPVECNWGKHPADHVHVWGESRYDKIPTCHEHDAESRAAVETMGGQIKETRPVRKTAARDEDFLRSLTFEHRDHSRYGMGVLVAQHPDMPDTSRYNNYVGHIAWLTDTGEVAGIEVHKDHQRKGLATELWSRAKEIVPHLKHSDHQSDDGRAWARTTAARDVDERAHERGLGAEWRDSLPPEHDELIKAWERAPGEVGTGKIRNQFRKILGTAPEVEGPVYRGDQPKNCFYKHDFEKKHQPGMKVNFPRWSSTSTRPEVAAGFGRVVYEIHDHGARAIGNTLHEGVMPPGKYQVHSAEWRKGPVRANIDGRTMHESEFLHVVLHPAEGKEGAREPSARLFGPTHGLDHRLFEGEHLKPDVRRYILETLGEFWKPRHGVGWDEWARVYFAGSEASEWTSETLEGNGDFDVLIGVDYDAYRGHQSRSEAVKTDEEITDELNAELRMLSEKTSTVWIPVRTDMQRSAAWDDRRSFPLQNQSGSSRTTSRGTSPRPPSARGTGSTPARFAGTSTSRESSAIRSVECPEASAPSAGLAKRHQSKLHKGLVDPARHGTSGVATSGSTSASPSSSSRNSWPIRMEAAGSAGGRTSSSPWTTTTDAVPAGAHAGSASEASSARVATRVSASSVKPIFAPQSTGLTVESLPPLPDGWEWTGPWNGTWYVNHDSWDIRKIKPYAAYNVSDDVWAVKPPHLEDWDITRFPEGQAFLDEAHAVEAYVKAILEMPEPYRSQQGNALWEHLHSDRSRAFGPQGEGWYDPGNALEKYLDQKGLWEQLAAIHFNAKDHPEVLNSPTNWSNDPRV